MLEHVRMGGRPYDARGQHIAEMVQELTILSRFRRANAGRLLEGDTATLVEQTTAYYENLQRNMKSLATRRGYETYFESWQPMTVTEESVVIEGLKHMFVTQSIDQRIEDALPLIARIQQQENAMKEATIFESWADQLMEGTWQLPDTPEKQTKLIELLSTDLPVGADATNATEQLYDLLGDDELFDQLQALADEDANADARQVILNRMQELGSDPDVMKVITSLNIDATATMNPPEQTPADLDADQEPVQETEYPEYAQDLSSILKHAGVPDQERPAPDYEPEVTEGQGGDVMWKELDRVTRLERLRDVAKRMGDKEEFAKLDAEIKDIYSKPTTEEANPGVTPADIDGVPKQELDEFAPLAAAIGGALGRAAVGTAAGTIKRGLAGMAGSAIGNDIGNAVGNNDEIDEAMCNMTEAGEHCDKHGMEECWDNKQQPTALQGQYGHSGRMKEVGKDSSFLDRLKELSGMIKT